MTTTTTIQQMLSNIVADLVPYYMDAVLLPNQQLISNQLNVAGVSGDQVRFPLTNSYTVAADVAEGGEIDAAAQSNLTPTAANVSFQKRGVGVNVTEESLEDGGFDMVQSATLTRLAGGLAEATDTAGFVSAKAGFTATALGESGSNADFITNIVMSPEGMAYVSKREPSISTWYNPNKDLHEFRGTVRNGFTVLRAGFGQKITSHGTVGTANSAIVNVKQIAQATSVLRGNNAPTGLDGSYAAVICPAYEFAINEALAQVGSSTIGSLSDLGNNALRNALVNMLAGATIYRSNNLADAS
jgi:hypothetical protein